MKKKPILYTEVAYLIGLFLLAFGNSLLEKAGLGLSMVVAPAYILHVKISELLPFFSFGMSCYVFQAAVLLLLIFITRRARLSYLFSFVTAVAHGLLLDLAMLVISPIVASELWARILLLVLGMPLSASGIALLFHTYLLPEVYELFVKEMVRMFDRPLVQVKTLYDLSSLLLATLLSLILFGGLVGIGIGTLACALLNGLLISGFDKLYTKVFREKDIFPLRRHFE